MDPGTHYPHRIRLRGPWDCVPLSSPGRPPLPSPRRVELPCRWRRAGLEGFVGTVRFRRRFGYPGRIDDGERVWLTVAGLAGRAEISLNGQSLPLRDPSLPDQEFDVTGLLIARNELTIDVTAATDDGGLDGEVALEVRRTAFLKGVEGRPASAEGINVVGRVVGTSDRPLDLYVLGGGKTLGYATVRPCEAGQPFRLAVGSVGPGVTRLRVELVDGGTIWYGVDLDI